MPAYTTGVSQTCPGSRPNSHILLPVLSCEFKRSADVTACRFETNNWAQHAQHEAPSNLQKPALDFRLYAVTDSACNARCQRSNAGAVREAIEGGVTLVQLREKDAEGGAFIREAEQVMEVARASGVG